MKRICPIVIAALLLAATAVFATAPAAHAQENIQIQYGDTQKYTGIRDRLRQRKALETLREFLSPMTFPLTIKAAECGAYYAPFQSPSSTMTLCYEYVDLIESIVPGEKTLASPKDFEGVYRNMGQLGPMLISREMATVGPFVAYVLHETAIAVFDKLDVPVWGRLHDAADYASAYLLFQFGTDVARKTIYGTAYFLNQWDIATRDTNFSDPDYLGDIRPTVRQRYYNLLCMALGRDPIGFSPFIPLTGKADNKLPDITLPLERFAHCRGAVERGGVSTDYAKVRNAFLTTVMPSLDAEKLKKVQGTQWIPDAKE